MRRYRFRLEQVLRVRRLQEEQARGELADARRRLDGSSARLRQALEAYQARMDERLQAPTGEALVERDRRAALARGVTAARVAEANALLTFRTSLDQWQEAARRVQGLERLDERHRSEHEIELDRAEQVVVDDLAAARATHPRARRAAEEPS